MKILLTKLTSKAGNIFVITLILSSILLLGLGSYYYFVHWENKMVAESQAWNAALACAEAGVEEGLAQLNVVFGMSNYVASIQTNFVPFSGGVYGPRTNTMTNGSYSVVIAVTNDYPIIVSSGYTEVPLIGKKIVRTVKVTTTSAQAFGGAIAAMLDVDMKGNNITVDSYDSADPDHSTNGMYNAATRKANGDVASTTGFINVQNANVYGHIRTSPWGSATCGANGRVGDLTFPGPGIQEGWYLKDYNADFPDVTPPFNPASAFSVTPNGTGTNTYILGSGNWISTGDLDLKSGETLYVNGNASVWVQGNFTMQSQGGSFIVIAPGVTLKFYVGTTSGPAVSSTFTTVNNTGNAYNFQYFGLPSNTAVTWCGNATYAGTVFAPEADFSLGGGGNIDYDYQGACVVKSVTMNGHFSFHYDENLKRNGPPTGYTVASWEEF